MAAIYSGTGGYLDRIKVERVRDFHEQMLSRLHSEQSDLMEKIGNGDWSDDIEEALGKEIADSIDDFGADFDEELHPIEEGESDRIKSEEEREAPARTASDDDSEDEDSDSDDDGSEDETEEQKEEAATTA